MDDQGRTANKDVALRALGHVTVAAGYLDFASGVLVKRLAVGKKPQRDLGKKLRQIGEMLADDRLSPLMQDLAEWKASAELATKARNRVVHDPIIYGDRGFYDGLVQFCNGKTIKIDPQTLEDLAKTLETLAQQAIGFSLQVFKLIGGPVAEEEQEDAPPVAVEAGTEAPFRDNVAGQ